MFDRVARRYDLANHLLSFGRDFFWRRRAAEIVGLDFSSAMLAVARRKGVRHLIAADAAQLPLAEQSFDAVTIAFGLRNVRDWAAALREMRRVLTSAGHLLVLDFSLPPKPILHFLYRFYLRQI